MISKFEKNNSFEYFIILENELDCHTINGISDDFKKIFYDLLHKYEHECKDNGLSYLTQIYLKIYLSDPINQVEVIKKYFEYKDVFYIIIGQPPASGSKIAFEAYHIKSKNLFKDIQDNMILYKHNGYDSVIGIIFPDNKKENVLSQTKNIFLQMKTLANNYNKKLIDFIQRTWFYIRDIDKNYDGMAKGRNQYFDNEKINEMTHYISSTGIEGYSINYGCTVYSSYFAINGLAHEQINYLNALRFLCPTVNYNVTFERGTQITYGDRSHYYISGTASIDSKGNILYLNSVIRQAQRILININELLKSKNSSINEMKLFIIYLRDFSDYECVKNFFSNMNMNIPYLIVRAPVCRPGWLIEIEGIAINDCGNLLYSDF